MAFSGRTLVIGLAFVVSCSSATGIRGVFVRTGQAEYGLQDARDGKIDVVLVNRGVRAVAITGCPNPPSAVLERRGDHGFVEASQYGLICLGIHSPRTEFVQSGDSRAFHVAAMEPGRYRLRVLLGAEWGKAEHMEYSNEFVVR